VAEKVYRHRLPVRISHWLNVPILIILIMSGLQIFNAHPALYWAIVLIVTSRYSRFAL
jgi:cytochrome b subunit of formate dehydrogenase